LSWHTETETIRALFKLIRIPDSLFIALGIFLPGLLVRGLTGFRLEQLLAFFVVFFSAAGAFALDDYCDFEVDNENNRSDRPLMHGFLPRKLGLATGVVSVFIVVPLSLFLGPVVLAFVSANLLLFISYSLALEKVLFVKNVIIAYAYVATIVFGAIVVNVVLEPLVLYFALMGFIIGFAFEIMLDIGDVEGDKKLGITTIPSRFGVFRAAQASVALYSAIMILDLLPFFMMISPRLYMNYVFLILVLIPVASYFVVSKSLIKDQSKGQIARQKRRVYVTMIVGSIVYIIGVML